MKATSPPASVARTVAPAGLSVSPNGPDAVSAMPPPPAIRVTSAGPMRFWRVWHSTPTGSLNGLNCPVLCEMYSVAPARTFSSSASHCRLEITICPVMHGSR